MVHAPIVPQLREAPMLIRTASDAVPVQPAAWHDVHGAASTLALALLYPSNSLRAFPAVERIGEIKWIYKGQGRASWLGSSVVQTKS